MSSVTRIDDPGEGWQVTNDWAANLCGGFLPDFCRRIAEAGAQATPLTLAAEECKRLYPGHIWPWYTAAVSRINREGAMNAREHRVLVVYRNAMDEQRRARSL